MCSIPLTLNEITSRMTLLLILLQKSRYILENDYPKHYDYEGEGSVTGSIGSCSFIESTDDLEFLNNLGSKFNTLAEVCGFRQTDPKVIANPVETTPNAAASSSHVTNIIQPSPEEMTIKSPLVQPAPNQGIVTQEPMHYGFNQPMASNVVVPCHCPMSPQIFYPVSSQELSGMVHMNQTVVDASLSSAQNEGTVTTVETVIGSNVLIGGPGTPNLVTVPQMANGQVNSQLLISGPYWSASNEGGESRLLVSGLSILEAPISGGNLLVAGPGQYPVSMSAGTPNLRLPQVATEQVLVNGLLPNVQNIVSGKGGQSRPLVSGTTILERSSQLPLSMSPGVLSPVELPQAANRQLFRSTASRVLTSMVMMPKSKGLATNGQLNVEK